MASAQRPTGQFILYGIVGGILAGIVFATFEMVVAVMGIGTSFFDPLRLIGSMVLGIGHRTQLSAERGAAPRAPG